MKTMPRFAAALVAAFLLAVPASAQFAQNTIMSVGGTGTAYTGTLFNTSSLAAIANVQLMFVPNTGGTGDATLVLTGNSVFSAKHFLKNSSGGLTPLATGDFVADQPYVVSYDATNDTFDVISGITTGSASALPQGYLTPCPAAGGVSGCTAGTLMPTGDVTAATALYYEPAFGSAVPIYNGSAFISFQFSELTLTIPSSRLASTIYDVFIINNGGVATACFGPAWTTSTAGSGARGTGAATAQISQVNGVWTNAVSQAGCVNGASSYAVAANQGTYVATCLIDGTNGQVSFYRTWGQSRKWACWNAYNRQNITLQAGDGTASWGYTTATIRPSNGSTNNKLTTLVGLPLDAIQYTFQQTMIPTLPVAAQNTGCQIGIGYNSTTAFSGTTGQVLINETGSPSVLVQSSVPASYTPTPAIGAEVITALETIVGTNGATFLGTQSSMLLQAQFRG